MNITIIEDEKLLSSNIAKKLNKNWYNTNIIDSYDSYKNSRYIKSDIYIIDISLRDWSWFDIIEDLRKVKKIKEPIIITSWYDNIDKKIYWLDLWADDYLSKPYDVEELIARIRALLRRSFNIDDNEIRYNNITYNQKNKLIKIDWKEIDLRTKEIQLIEYFLFNIWKVITKSELTSSVWWNYGDIEITDNTINVTLSKIRKKLGESFKLKTLINRWYLLEK